MPDGTSWLDIVNMAGSLIAGIATIIIAIMVQHYARRRDRAAIIQGMWQQQQEWNLTAAGSPAHALAIEQMAYGMKPTIEEERLALIQCIFFFLNRVKHVWDAVEEGLFSEQEFVTEVMPNLKLLAGQKELVFALLRERGYGESFDMTVMNLIEPLDIVGPVDVFGTSGKVTKPR